jgi:hypothetical protein|tara:strand:- start:727 stop:1164 length:438 start_codon:yes stop_codon:yes gene_type:complete
MALPASGPISSSMIAQEFSSSQAPSGPNISLFGLASELGTPVTSNIFMGASFYGQSSGPTAFSYNSTGQEGRGGPAAACELESIEDTAYHDGSGTYPVAGDNVYSNSAGTTPLSAGLSYKIDNGTNSSMQISAATAGLVFAINAC